MNSNIPIGYNNEGEFIGFNDLRSRDVFKPNKKPIMGKVFLSPRIMSDKKFTTLNKKDI